MSFFSNIGQKTFIDANGVKWESFEPDELPDISIYDNNYNNNASSKVNNIFEQNTNTVDISRIEICDQKDSTDSFEDYLELVDVDKDSATNTELTDAMNNYERQVAKKNEFIELYNLFMNSNKRDDYETFGIDEIYKSLQQTGVFKTGDEAGDDDYNENIEVLIDTAIEEMNLEINKSGQSKTKKSAKNITEKYSKETNYVVGKRNSKNVNINGEIDEGVKQQGTGDCYLLATLNSIQKTDKGREILKNSIVDNKDGSYTVKLNGVGKEYTFSNEEIEAADLKTVQKKSNDGSVLGSGMGFYSEGDDDAMLIEMAVEKFRQGLYDGSITPDPSWPKSVSMTVSKEKADAGQSALTSGSMNQIMYLFTGKNVHATSAKNDGINNLLDEVSKNPGKYVVYASVNAKNGYEKSETGDYAIDPKKNIFSKAVDGISNFAQKYMFKNVGSNKSGAITLNGVGESKGQSIKITNNSTGNHAISIVAATDNTVTIINPWDSKKCITVDRKEFMQYMNYAQFMNMETETA